MGEYKIEKGVVLPTRQAYRSKFADLADALEVGDSWLVPALSEKNSCRAFLVRRGFKVATRKEGHAIRMWCLGKPDNHNG